MLGLLAAGRRRRPRRRLRLTRPVHSTLRTEDTMTEGDSACRVGTSPRSGRPSPSSSPTRRPRCRATSAYTWRRVRRAGQRHRRHAPRRPGWSSRTRSPTTSTTAPSTSSRCSGSGRRAARRSTRTTATPTTSSSTSGTTPTRSPSSSTARSSRPSSASATGSTASGCGSGSTTAPAPAPRGRCPTSRPPRRTPTRVIPPWGRSGDHLYMLYTGGTTGMPKGVMWRQDDLFRNVVGAGFDARVAGRRARHGHHPRAGAGARHRRPAGLPAHARHRVHDPAHRHVGRGQRGHPREPRPRRRGPARHDRAREGQRHRHRRRRLRQAHPAGARRRRRTAGTCRASSSSPRRA